MSQFSTAKSPAYGFEKVIHVILEDNDNPLWDEYDIGAVPTVILFEDGKVTKRLDGRLGSGLKEERFLAWLDEFNTVTAFPFQAITSVKLNFIAN